MLVGLGDAGGSVGVGARGLLDCGVACALGFGVGSSGALFALALAGGVSLLFAALAFALSVGDGESAAFALALTFAVGLTGPPRGIPCSLCPVGDVPGCTGWLFGSADSAGCAWFVFAGCEPRVNA